MSTIDLGHRIEVRTWGTPSATGPTLVLLHHGLGSVATWGELPARLAERTGCQVVAYSRWGHGASAPLPDALRPVSFMHDEARDDLPGLLRALDLRRPLLVGHSDGASIALIYAAAGHAPAPQGLVLLAPHVFVEERTLAGIRAARKDYEQGDLRRRLARVHADPDGAFYGWNRAWLQPSFAAWNIEPELARIPRTCAVTVLQGDADEYGTEAQLVALRRGLGDHPALQIRLLPGCGHLPQRDRPEDVLDAVADLAQAQTQRVPPNPGATSP